MTSSAKWKRNFTGSVVSIILLIVSQFIAILAECTEEGSGFASFFRLTVFDTLAFFVQCKLLTNPLYLGKFQMMVYPALCWYSLIAGYYCDMLRFLAANLFAIQAISVSASYGMPIANAFHPYFPKV